MVRIALAPCSPFSVTAELMRATAELAERLDVRLHTHLAEDAGRGRLLPGHVRPAAGGATSTEVGWGTDRSWVAHCIRPNPDEVARLGGWGTGAAHCPSSNMILGSRAGARCGSCGRPARRSGWAATARRPRTRRRCGWRPGRRCCWASCGTGAGSTSARDALEIATRGGAGCLGRTGEIGELSVGACGDLAVWPLTGVPYAGALSDPVEAWLRCGPAAARHTVVAGEPVVVDGAPVHPGLDEMLALHRGVSARVQAG